MYEEYKKFFRITPKSTRTGFGVHNLTYEKYDTKEPNYSKADIDKVKSAKSLARVILSETKKHIKKLKPESIVIRMEGAVSANAFNKNNSRTNDLVCFNSIVKLYLLNFHNLYQII